MVGNEWQRKQGSVEVRLMEECSEVIQATSKGIRFGWDEIHPISREDNKTLLMKEMMDVVDIWNEFAAQNNLSRLFWERKNG